MGGTGRVDRPRKVIVVGAGIVGLSTAWFLQEHDVEVTVVERDQVAAGSSWGNAGWLSPGLAIPLNEPGVVRYGLRSLLDPRAPLYIPASIDPELWRFLALFAAHCRWGAWERAVQSNLVLNQECLDAFDALTEGGVAAKATSAPITALFRSERSAAGLLSELRRISEIGLPLDFTALSGDSVRQHVNQASDGIRAGIRISGQRYVNPGQFTEALADSVRERGGQVITDFDVSGLDQGSQSLTVRSKDGKAESADSIVVATGAWLGRQSRAWGIRVPLCAGRGYSFTVPSNTPVSGPVYLPEVRVACTPYGEGLRVAGTMEFRSADAPLDRARVETIAASAQPYLSDLAWPQRSDEWVGPRPVTTDGLPLVGRTAVPGLHVAGGHGMWGFSHGPATARYLARAVATGETPEALRAFDPTR